jgi:hypothetical protein
VKIKIDQQGQVHAVYSDKLRGLGLGELHVERASDVEFNHESDEWEARVRTTGELIAHGPNRDDVIKEEVRVLESRL